MNIKDGIIESQDKKGNYVFKDQNNRILIILDTRGKMAIARYPDMKQHYKNFIIDVYMNLIDDKVDIIERLKRFLDYEEDSDEFCA